MSWYDKNIESGIKGVVMLLRDNGFNTECSCEHEMYVQCQYIPEGEIKRLHDLLANHGFKDYIISVNMKVIEGHTYTDLTLEMKEGSDKQGSG